MISLSDKLKSLGVKMGPRDLPPCPPADHPIEQVVPGRFHATPRGETFVVETLYPPEYRHGRAALCVATSLRIVSEWAREARLVGLEPGAFVFLDTETTGLAGGTGTYAFLIGVGRHDGQHFRLAQFFMRDPIEEPALLAALTESLRPCGALVTFNGKAFDVPLLNARCVTNGETSPLTSAAHLDLLPLARRLWRDRLPSRALGYVEAHILGAARTHEDVAGCLIPALYFDYLRSGDARPLKSVFYHNAMDVLAMAALFSHVAQLMDDPLNSAVEHGLDLVAIGKLFEDLGHLEAAAKLYERGLERGLPEHFHRETVRRLSFVQRRRGNLSEAVEWWREAARSRQVYAHVELAKFYEHKLRDYREAEQWTRAALGLVNAPDFPLHARGPWLGDLEHRLARLRRKIR
ncbi:MAG: ribonuclease H-like domain-containing protein [Chloroflexi bacterium]|nr:ribonuclease H-like domain-containing protein [Chloroflexota bacterium]